MRRFVNQLVFMTAGVIVGIPVALSTGVDARWAIAIGVITGALAYFVTAVLIRRSDLTAFRVELERVGFKADAENDDEEDADDSPSVFSPLLRLIGSSFLVSKPAVSVLVTGAAKEIRDTSLHIWIEVPDEWPDFTIKPAHSVMERPKLGMQATNSGFAHPDFDRRFRVESGDLHDIEKRVNRSVQERLLVLPPRSEMTCDAGVLTIETGPILPLNTAKVVQACESLADKSAPKSGARG